MLLFFIIFFIIFYFLLFFIILFLLFFITEQKRFPTPSEESNPIKQSDKAEKSKAIR